MTRKENIKQHYIPQLYLRNFTDEMGFITVYDIERDKEYSVNPSKESYEKYFHDINLEIFEIVLDGKMVNVQFVDECIRKLHEEKIAQVLKYVEYEFLKITGKNCDGIPLDHKYIENINEFIILQMIRTPEYRKRINYYCLNFCLYFGINIEELNITEIELLQSIHNLLLYGLIMVFSDKTDELPKKYTNFFAHKINELLEMYEQLNEYLVVVLINDSTIPFCTGSMPIVVRYDPSTYMPVKALVAQLCEDGCVTDIGTNDEILRLYIPLSKRCGIFFFKNEYAKSLGEFGDAISNFGRSIGYISEWNKDIAENLNIVLAAESKGKIYGPISYKESIRKAKNEKKEVQIKLRF